MIIINFSQAANIFVPNHDDAFNNIMLTNVLTNWYLMFAKKTFEILSGSTEYNELFNKVFPGDATREFKKGMQITAIWSELQNSQRIKVG